MSLRICGSFKTAMQIASQQISERIRFSSQFRKFAKSMEGPLIKLFKSVNLRFSELNCGLSIFSEQ